MPQTAYFSRTYDETMTLMMEARNYLAYAERRERRKAGNIIGLRMSCEAMRVTSRLTQVMAWLMMQRAVHEGEVTADHMLRDECRLSGTEVCLDETFAEDENLPTRLRSLMERSFRLYVRVARLEELLMRRVLH